jgi:O-antigen/teichoic acid export membrane protein
LVGKLARGQRRWSFWPVKSLAIRASLVSRASHPLIRGGAWTLIGQVGAQSVALAANTTVAHLLGVTNFGLFSLVQTTGNTAAAVAGYGPSLVATRAAAGARLSRSGAEIATRGALRIALFAGAAASALLAALGPWYARVVVRSTGALPALGLGSILAAPLVVFMTCSALLAGFGVFRLLALGRIVSAPIAAILTVAGALTFGTPGAIAGLLLGAVASAVIARFQVRQVLRSIADAPTSCVPASRASRELLLPAVLASIASAPVLWICQTLLAARDGLGSVAIIGAAMIWGQALLLVPASLGQALMAELAHALSIGDDTARRVYRIGWTATVVTTVPLLIGLSILTPYVLRVYGFSDPAAPMAFRAIVAAYALQGVTGAPIKVLEAGGRLWTHLGCNLVWATALIGGTWLWRLDGARGFGYAALTAFSLHCALVHLLAYRMLFRSNERDA